jgi:hypothetical protein
MSDCDCGCKDQSELIAELQRKLKESEAQQASTYHFAAAELKRLSLDRCMGGAVILELTTLGGKKKVGPVAIRDGLSPETIAAIHADLARSYALAVEFKP